MAVEMASLEVRRAPGGVTDHLRGYEVVVDGVTIGRLHPGESDVFELAPGPHELFMKIDWARSEKVDLELAAGKTATFRCEPRANVLTALYWASIGCRRYIRLVRVPD